MKQLFYTVAASLFTFGAMAQITISSVANIPAGKVDTCGLPTATALASLPSLAPMVNGTLDLGTIALQTSVFVYAYRAPTSGFPTATFADSLTYSLSAVPGIGYKSWRNIQQSGTGVMIQGEEIITRQAKGLGAVTGNNIDSIIFPTQVIVYNNPLPILKFPATMSSKWSATTNRNMTFNITVTALALNNATAMHKQVHVFVDSVVGWGSVKVPVVGKGASTAIPVLQVQHSEINVDSFFLNGVPASAALLTAIGVSQGQSTTTARTFFYRSGNFRPLVEAVHSGPTHSSTASKLYLHAQELEPEAVPSLLAAGDIRVYPNPVRNGMLHLDLPQNTKAGWSYSLVHIDGRLIAQGALALTAAQRSTVISLPAGLQAGIYYMTLINADKQIAVVPITIE